MLSLDDIDAARARLAGSILCTPCNRSAAFSRLLGCRAYLKLENQQMTGSFKERGARNRLLLLSEEERGRGVIAASAGNHAQGLAYNATTLGISSKVVMPIGTPLTKVSATQGYGGEVVLHGMNYDEAFEKALELRDAEGRTLVHAFDDLHVMAGQGTIGLELLEQVPDLDAVVVPIGGGGLISGVATAIKAHKPEVKIYGVESDAVPSARASVRAGEIVSVPPGVTIADGIAVKRPGELTFPVIQRLVDMIVTVNDEEIANAIMLLLEREKTVAEGAGAAAVAAVYHKKLDLSGKSVVFLVCGGNIDMGSLSRVIERGLVKDGRVTAFNLRIVDQPGALAQLTALLGQHKANILQIEHNRAFRDVHFGQAEIHIVLETRGRDHAATIERALDEHGYRPERIHGLSW